MAGEISRRSNYACSKEIILVLVAVWIISCNARTLFKEEHLEPTKEEYWKTIEDNEEYSEPTKEEYFEPIGVEYLEPIREEYFEPTRVNFLDKAVVKSIEGFSSSEKMPTFSKPASGFWSKFRFQEPLGAFDYVKASQPRFKPASKYNPVQSSAMRTTMIGSHGKSDDVEVSGGPSDQGFELQEDPSFWKDHNIQMSTFSKPASSFWSRIHFQERPDPSFDYEQSIPPCCKKIRSHGKSDEVEVSVEPSDFKLQEYPLEIEAKVAAKEEWANIKDVKEDYDPNWHSDSGATRHMALDALSFIILMFIMVWIG